MTQTVVKFENPFRDLPPEERKRTTIDIPLKLESDLQRVKSGTILQTTINILWKKLHDELHRLGITTVKDQERFERFVTECRIVWGDDSGTFNEGHVFVGGPDDTTQRSAAVGVVPKAETPHVPGRTDSGSASDKVITDKPTDVPSRVRKGRGDGTKGKKR